MAGAGNGESILTPENETKVNKLFDQYCKKVSVSKKRNKRIR
jgi:hypothetical protein